MSEALKEELEVLAGEPLPSNVVTLVDGRRVQILKCTVEFMGTVSAGLQVIFAALGIKDLSGIVRMNLDDPATYFQLFSTCYPEFVELASGLCDLPKGAFEKLELDDALAIVAKEWTVNRDFFLKRVVPALFASLNPETIDRIKAAAQAAVKEL